MKISCPGGTHEDNTPSCKIYPDGSAYCFSCSSYFPTGTDFKGAVPKISSAAEDLGSTQQYIRALPTIDHRGLTFHYDKVGYYILFPNSNYYKQRVWVSKDGYGKYISPKGHKKPLFFIKSPVATKKLIVVEGEINAWSICTALHTSESHPADSFDILSPGGVSSFTDSEITKNLGLFRNYKTVFILVDNDRSGVGLIAAIKLKNLILPSVPDVVIKLMDQDCNEILINGGTYALREEIKNLEM